MIWYFFLFNIKFLRYGICELDNYTSDFNHISGWQICLMLHIRVSEIEHA